MINKIESLKKQLKRIKNQIIETDRSRMREVKKAEQKKRAQIIHKQGYEVPSLKSAADRSMRKSPKNKLNQQSKSNEEISES